MESVIVMYSVTALKLYFMFGMAVGMSLIGALWLLYELTTKHKKDLGGE